MAAQAVNRLVAEVAVEGSNPSATAIATLVFPQRRTRCRAGTDTAERDTAIRRAYYGGRSAIELATAYSLSRSQVHRIVAAGPPADDDDGTEETLAPLDADPERVVVQPLTYVGMERERGRWVARWVYTVGPVNALEIYRYQFRNGSVADDEL